MDINKLRNNTLNNSNEATGSRNNYSFNTPSPATPRSITPCSINTHLTNTRPTNTTNTRPTNTTNTRPTNTTNTRPTNTTNMRPTNTRTCFDNTDFNDEDFYPYAHNNRSTFGTPNYNATFQSNRSNNSESTFPVPFRDMDNIHQICSWLCTNPNILLLAYNIYMSMQAPVENGFNFVSPTFNSPMLATGTRHIQDDRVRSSNNFIFVIIYFCC